jgi:hypothetical protein
MMTLAVSTATAVILRGPLAKALAERISGRASQPDPVVAGDIERLHEEVEEMKHRVAEAEERLDFAERLLAKQRDVERLKG